MRMAANEAMPATVNAWPYSSAVVGTPSERRLELIVAASDARTRAATAAAMARPRMATSSPLSRPARRAMRPAT